MMETALTLLIGFLFTCGFYLMLRRNLTRILMGVLFIGQAANLALLVVPGPGTGQAAIIKAGQTQLAAAAPDPLPQALILTAIVIGFGLIAFALVLLRNAYATLKTDDADHLTHTEGLEQEGEPKP